MPSFCNALATKLLQYETLLALTTSHILSEMNLYIVDKVHANYQVNQF
jgi:hypothetical protein